MAALIQPEPNSRFEVAVPIDRNALKSLAVVAARSEREREHIYRFRYAVLVDELGHEPDNADHAKRMIRDRLDETSLLLYLASGGTVAATLRLNFAAKSAVPREFYNAYQLERFNAYADSNFSLTSAQIVAEDWRQTPALSVLRGAVYKMCRKQRIRFDFCHCPPAQLSLFHRLGYRRYGSNFVADSSLQVPLTMLLEDVRHLKVVKSPLLAMACTFENSSETAFWFMRNFPEAEAATQTANLDESEFWAYLNKVLHETPLESVPLLKNLSGDEAKRLLGAGTVMTCRKDETVIRAGDVGNEIFVLLSGAVEVRGGKNADQVIATLDKGEIFGEVAFLSEVKRTATVVALSDIEVLILTQDYLRKILETMPEIAGKLMFNLSVTLCRRLVSSTSDLVEGGAQAASFTPTTEGSWQRAASG